MKLANSFIKPARKLQKIMRLETKLSAIYKYYDEIYYYILFL